MPVGGAVQRSDSLVNEMERRIAVARGETEGDVLLKNGRLVDVFCGEVREASVITCGDRIAGVGEGYTKACEVIDLEGRYLLPGLIDGHIHFESSHCTMAEFARAVLVHGTTTVIIDPHEIVNVLGLAGLDYVLRSSRSIPLDVFVMVPSCVPATPLETAGADLGEDEIAEALRYDRVIGLGEMMNFPGVIHGSLDVLKKLAAAWQAGAVIDGHAPLVRGHDLNAYVAAGIASDHECTRPEEALEKLRLGMRVMIREGSAAKNLRDLLPVVTQSNLRRFFFVSDDCHPADLFRNGHMDAILREAVGLGLDPVSAVRLTSLNTAEYFGLNRRGAVAPGYVADLVVADDLRDFRVRTVMKSGKFAVREGRLTADIPACVGDEVRRTVHIRPLSAESFRIEARGAKARVIGLVPDQIVTAARAEKIKTESGLVVSDTDRDILKLAVIERHKRTGNIGLGLVSGFGLRQGALASSVAHDSHNIIVVGVQDEDMLLAVREIEKMEGGFVVVAGGKVLASLPLPIAGLISDQPLEKICAGLDRVHQAAKGLGTIPASPFTTLSFLALPVIPELKLTDQGLVDVGTFRVIDLFV